MRTYMVDPHVCDRSPACPARRVCPNGAIVPRIGGPHPGYDGYEVDASRCSGCGICARVCPTGAVTPA